MTGSARFRALLSAAVALVLLGGITLVATPTTPAAAPPADQPVEPPPPSQGTSGQAVTPPASVRTDAVDELFKRRADAVLRRDEQAFMATVDKDADEEFQTAQRALFANLAQVPLLHWTYVVHPDRALDPAVLPAAAAADELWAPEVELNYALKGADVVPTKRPMGYLLARHGTDWSLRSDTDLEGVGRRTWRGPWDFGPCLVIVTGRGLVISHPAREPMARRMAQELDAAVRAVSDVWGTDWSQQVALLLPDTPDEMRAMVGPTFPVESVVAVSVADRVDAASRTAAGQRVVMSPATADGLSVAALRIVLRHEIAHVAARGATVDGSPMWLLEGFADYVGYRESGIPLAKAAPDLAALVNSSGPPARLPADEDFRKSGRDLDLAYQQALSLARYIADTFGEAKLMELYRSMAGLGKASAQDIDGALRPIIGIDQQRLVAAWQQYLRGAVG